MPAVKTKKVAQRDPALDAVVADIRRRPVQPPTEGLKQAVKEAKAAYGNG